jgi:hypothetical protein
VVQDELLWAAIWLHEATGESSYLDFVVRNAAGGTCNMKEFSWDAKYAGLQILVSKVQYTNVDPLIKRVKTEP